MDTKTRTPAVTIRETDLFSVFCHALESGEFTQIRGSMYGVGNERCAYGVAATILHRAGFHDASTYQPIHPHFAAIVCRAGDLLGCADVAAANDAGHSFTLIAAALRRARLDLEVSNG